MFMMHKSIAMPTSEQALPGRDTPMPVPAEHYVNGHPLSPPFPAGMQQVLFGMGCFWGAERRFWQIEGVYTTAVGYAAGYTPNPTYHEVCTGQTGHAEVIQVTFDPSLVSYADLLKIFWQAHDPTQLNRQGNDVGPQYRSVIFTHNEEQAAVADDDDPRHALPLRAVEEEALLRRLPRGRLRGDSRSGRRHHLGPAHPRLADRWYPPPSAKSTGGQRSGCRAAGRGQWPTYLSRQDPLGRGAPAYRSRCHRPRGH